MNRCAGAMVAATSHAKGAFPERHRNYLGLMGFGGHANVRTYLEQVDVMMVVGSRLGDISTNGWSDDLAPSRALIHVDREPGAIGRNYPADVAIVGDSAMALRAMVDELPADTAHRSPAGPALDLDADISRAHDTVPIKPQWLMAALERGLPVNTIFTVDIGEHAAFALHHLRVDAPDRFHVFAGLGSMGSGFCSAVGMKIARPNEPVVAIAGDGGFAMHAGELLTCVEENIAVMFVILNDGRYRMVDAGMQQIFGRKSPGAPNRMADLAGMANASGAIGVTVKYGADLGPGRLNALLAMKRPILLDVHIDASEHLSLATRTASIKHFSSTGGGQGASR